MDHKTEDEKQAPARQPRKATREERAKLAWAGQPLPDPAYDPRTGWKLDEFAMYCEPYELQKYKECSYVRHHYSVVQRKLNFFEYVRIHTFPQILKKRLLGFRVTGFRPGSYEAEEIPLSLLEVMHPIVELSELVDYYHNPPLRRYELVRVFEATPPKTSRGGKKPTYNWPKLIEELRRDGRTFETRAALIEYCRTNVRPLPGKRASRDGPDDNTIRPVISLHELDKLIKSRGP
jgi:hypothetical protein